MGFPSQLIINYDSQVFYLIHLFQLTLTHKDITVFRNVIYALVGYNHKFRFL